jgi:hypothetical protein
VLFAAELSIVKDDYVKWMIENAGQFPDHQAPGPGGGSRISASGSRAKPSSRKFMTA